MSERPERKSSSESEANFDSGHFRRDACYWLFNSNRSLKRDVNGFILFCFNLNRYVYIY